MSDTKISALTELAAADVDKAADFFAIVDTGAGATKKVTPQSIGISVGAPKTWVRFNAAGTIDESYNVTSITDSGVGSWTVNVATDFAAATWVPVISGGQINGVSAMTYNITGVAAGTASIQGTSIASGAAADPDQINGITLVGFGAQ